MAESELRDEILPEECSFCPTKDNESNIMGISCCEECAEKYAINPVEFEKKIMSAF